MTKNTEDRTFASGHEFEKEANEKVAQARAFIEGGGCGFSFFQLGICDEKPAIFVLGSPPVESVYVDKGLIVHLPREVINLGGLKALLFEYEGNLYHWCDIYAHALHPYILMLEQKTQNDFFVFPAKGVFVLPSNFSGIVQHSYQNGKYHLDYTLRQMHLEYLALKLKEKAC
ncbi:hypothetical protein [Helicobacter sp. L8]|uniref:hypothetical protein n=1 Tax=Helicobacter sp. L8 TaxID=2316078 RepID=UPI000EAE1730|nr:hypothetical protein [Helicobacter sp. L8]